MRRGLHRDIRHRVDVSIDGFQMGYFHGARPPMFIIIATKVKNQGGKRPLATVFRFCAKRWANRFIKL
jgi:hypothetical protein